MFHRIATWVGLTSALVATSCKGNTATTTSTDAAAPSAVAADASSSAATAEDASSGTTANAGTSTHPAVKASSPKQQGQTYYWAPEIVTISGTLVKKQIQYSSGPVPVVVFDAPIHIQEKPGSKTSSPAKDDVTEAWLSYNGISKNAVDKLIGKRVSFRGTLNPMQTGSQLSDPWLAGTVTAGAATETVSATAKAIDTSDWKGASPGSTLSLQWTADQSRAKPPITSPTQDMTKTVVPLDLVLSLNGHKHSVSLQANGAPPYASKCGALSFFWADINLPFALDRAEGDKVVLTRNGKQLYVFDVPSSVKVAQEVVTIDPQGKRSSTAACSPTTL